MSDVTLSQLKEKASAITPAKNRLTYLFDNKKFTELDSLVLSGEDLSGVVTAYGYVNSFPIYAFAQDSSIKNGALTAEGAKKIAKVYDLAEKTGLPVVGIYDSYGADINNGFSAMNNYGELLKRTSRLSGVVPQIAVVAGVCTGMASVLVANSDFAVMTEDSQLYASPNQGENSAKLCAENGVVAKVAKDENEAIDFAKDILGKLPQNNLEPSTQFEFARSEKPFSKTIEGIADSICDVNSVVEVYQQKGCASYTALATIEGSTVGIVATSKNDTICPCDCAKIARFVRTLDAFAIPVVTFVDTKGFRNDAKAEEKGIINAMAKLSASYSEATTAKVAVVVGNAYGSAFTCLAGKGANADVVLATPDAVISALDPVTAVEFLYHDKLSGAKNLAEERNKLAKEYAETQANAALAGANGVVDAVVDTNNLRDTLVEVLYMLEGKREPTLPKKHGNMPL